MRIDLPQHLYLHIRERLPQRFVEWLCGWEIFQLGWAMFFYPDTFSKAAIAPFLSYPGLDTPYRWAFLSIFIGTVRLTALFINGFRPQLSSSLRCVGAIFGVGYFAIFTGQSYETFTASTVSFGAFTYGALMVADIYSTIRSARDAYTAWR